LAHQFWQPIGSPTKTAQYPRCNDFSSKKKASRFELNTYTRLHRLKNKDMVDLWEDGRFKINVNVALSKNTSMALAAAKQEMRMVDLWEPRH
jgi:ribosomal protein S10